MRLPKAWNDRNLLNDEPFRSQFLYSRGNRFTPNHLFAGIMMDVLKEDSGKAAVATWLDLAFKTNDEPSHVVVRVDRFKKRHSTSEFFVEMFWALFQNTSDEPAMSILNKQRKHAGLTYTITRAAALAKLRDAPPVVQPRTKPIVNSTGTKQGSKRDSSKLDASPGFMSSSASSQQCTQQKRSKYKRTRDSVPQGISNASQGGPLPESEPGPSAMRNGRKCRSVIVSEGASEPSEPQSPLSPPWPRTSGTVVCEASVQIPCEEKASLVQTDDPKPPTPAHSSKSEPSTKREDEEPVITMEEINSLGTVVVQQRSTTKKRGARAKAARAKAAARTAVNGNTQPTNEGNEQPQTEMPPSPPASLENDETRTTKKKGRRRGKKRKRAPEEDAAPSLTHEELPEVHSLPTPISDSASDPAASQYSSSVPPGPNEDKGMLHEEGVTEARLTKSKPAGVHSILTPISDGADSSDPAPSRSTPFTSPGAGEDTGASAAKGVPEARPTKRRKTKNTSTAPKKETSGSSGPHPPETPKRKQKKNIAKAADPDSPLQLLTPPPTEKKKRGPRLKLEPTTPPSTSTLISLDTQPESTESTCSNIGTDAFKFIFFRPSEPASESHDLPAMSIPSPTNDTEAHIEELLPVEPQRYATLASGRSIDFCRQSIRTLGLNPLVWSKSRQELCESVNYFRSFQGGVFHSDGNVKGYLLGGFPSIRDGFLCDGKLIISHGGGKRKTKSNASGRIVDATDQQEQDKSVRALLKNHKYNQPLVLVADNMYREFPYDLHDCTYVVLGWYFIRDYWKEYQLAEGAPVVRYKFAFQWCDDQGKPWWWRPENLPVERRMPQRRAPTQFTYTPPKKVGLKIDIANGPPRTQATLVCDVCGNFSPSIYEQGWMCLAKPECPQFCRLPEDSIPDQLDYGTDFLRIAPNYGHFLSLPDVRPLDPSQLADKGITTSEYYLRGWHCKTCGRLSCRSEWTRWRCPNGCTERLPLATELHPRDIPHDLMPAAPHILPGSGIVMTGPHPYSWTNVDSGYCGSSNMYTFILPGSMGSIHHILGSRTVNEEADRIFLRYQEQANSGLLQLRRYPLKSHQLSGALLSNFFSHNCGEAYKYIGGSEVTTPFSQAPDAVVSALSLIASRARRVLADEISFNEILTVAYMERQEMSYHSDAEDGLGPNVASLSLGSPAKMFFRPRARGKGKAHLSIVLRHGDVLVMEGRGVQDRYEHAVSPDNFRIAATARSISPENNKQIFRTRK